MYGPDIQNPFVCEALYTYIHTSSAIRNPRQRERFRKFTHKDRTFQTYILKLPPRPSAVTKLSLTVSVRPSMSPACANHAPRRPQLTAEAAWGGARKSTSRNVTLSNVNVDALNLKNKISTNEHTRPDRPAPAAPLQVRAPSLIIALRQPQSIFTSPLMQLLPLTSR